MPLRMLMDVCRAHGGTTLASGDRATGITAGVREPLLQITEPNRPCSGTRSAEV
ncbi:MAG TPA: hypothetical protein VKV21_03135 [Solirubrobacteraceae bacterium]|nr:hypothetical protein [Solirubrobacteraceae bacterium]